MSIPARVATVAAAVTPPAVAPPATPWPNDAERVEHADNEQPARGAHDGRLAPALLIAVIALLALNLIFTAITTFRGTPTVSQEWEYKTTGIPDSLFDQKMNDLGRQGWELVFARRATVGDIGALYEVIFKRRR
jgi:hypothetical protein